MKNKKRYLLILLIVLVSVFATVWFLLTKNDLTITRYEVPAELTAPLRIVQLTDLHSWEFGENNQELVRQVAGQAPDLILITGDMLDKTDADARVACALIQQLAQIAPVYFSHGNHEKAWEHTNGASLEPELTAAGAVVLDGEYRDIEVNGQSLRLGGYYGYYRRPHMHLDDPVQQAADSAFCDDFENTRRCKILLCHIPTAWLDWGLIDDHPVDLVLTGHYHGGQVRLPILGGLIAPYVGWFPEFTEGMYVGEQATAILSTGLGSSPGIPRINNPPQIVTVDLIPET